jgi:hypothetical protein
MRNDGEFSAKTFYLQGNLLVENTLLQNAKFGPELLKSFNEKSKKNSTIKSNYN